MRIRPSRRPRRFPAAVGWAAATSAATTAAHCFTQEFLQDVGLTELNELGEYSVNAQLNFNDMGPDLNANSYVNATALVRKIDVRGLPAAIAA